MQFQIPQFIDAEDKIVGPLTLKQFLYVAAAGGLSFLFFVFLQTWIFLFLAIPIMVIGIGLAFFKVNGQSLPTVVGNAFRFYWGPQRYTWQPSNPQLPKNAATIKESVGLTESIENVLRGLALKNAWRYIQTGSKPKEEPILAPPKAPEKSKEQYQIFRRITGERRAAKRVDYR